MRPLLTVAAARLCGYSEGSDRHIKLATCVEFIHSAPCYMTTSSTEPRCVAQAHRQYSLGRQGVGAGRRLPVHARLRADGRGWFARHSLACSRMHPRPSPRARCCSWSVSATSARPRRPTSRSSRPDRQAVRRGLRGRAMVAGRNGPERVALQSFGMNSRHRLPAGRRCARLFRPRGQARQVGRRRLPRGARSPCR